MTKLSYAWVRNTPLFKSVSTGLTFDEKHKLAVDLMVEKLNGNGLDLCSRDVNYALKWTESCLGEETWYNWWRKTCKTTNAQ